MLSHSQANLTKEQEPARNSCSLLASALLASSCQPDFSTSSFALVFRSSHHHWRTKWRPMDALTRRSGHIPERVADAPRSSPAQRAANGGLDHAEYCSDNENAFYPTTNRLAGRGRQPQRRASSSNISTTSQVFTNLSISDTSNSQGSTASPDRTVSMRSAGSMRSSVSPDRTITASPSPDRGGRPTSRGRTNVPAPPSGGALPRTSPAPSQFSSLLSCITDRCLR